MKGGGISESNRFPEQLCPPTRPTGCPVTRGLTTSELICVSFTPRIDELIPKGSPSDLVTQ
eukprot:5483968-Prymnesium_polylepis.1